MDITFFDTQSAFREWLEQHHDSENELNIGFWKKESGKGGIAYGDAVDEALCFGWIDGIRRRVDDESYMTRFTPRRKGSIWSQVNIKKVAEFTEQGKMHAAGLKAFETRNPEKVNLYSAEQETVALNDEEEKRFKENAEAWDFFEKQAPTYKKAALWWVISAKKLETREKRFLSLIEESARGERIRQFVTPSRRKN